jgi:hypothetical protein
LVDKTEVSVKYNKWVVLNEIIQKIEIGEYECNVCVGARKGAKQVSRKYETTHGYDSS